MVELKKPSECPYDSYPSSSFWSRSISRIRAESIDPMLSSSFKIQKSTRVATAGSCFAQHIANRLKSMGFTYLVTEDCPSFIPDKIANRYGYRLFSARFANIYTLRQMHQLLLRAYGEFSPLEDVWKEGNNFVDPFRPFVQPNGFESLKAFQQDREQHFKAVRRMVSESDVFVFTLGLTESWIDVRDGAAFPVCPGCRAGLFNDERYIFKNFDYADVLEDGLQCIRFLRKWNPELKIILTVSPVPLVATASRNHVLTATTYSKSVLRAVAGKLEELHDNVLYFPSYEIITGAFNRGAYFERDLRSVNEAGVDHVMRVFFRHFSEDQTDERPQAEYSRGDLQELDHLRRMQVVCDEEILDKKSVI